MPWLESGLWPGQTVVVVMVLYHTAAVPCSNGPRESAFLRRGNFHLTVISLAMFTATELKVPK